MKKKITKFLKIDYIKKHPILVAVSTLVSISLILSLIIYFSKQTYNIVFKNYDGTILEEQLVRKGEMPVFNGSPERASDGEHEYVFYSWDKQVTAAVKDETYTALYSSTIEGSTDKANVTSDNMSLLTNETDTSEDLVNSYYLVEFFDNDGSLFEASEYKYGDMPSFNGTIEDKVIDGYKYTFKSWNEPFNIVTGDQSYTAIYERIQIDESSDLSTEDQLNTLATSPSISPLTPLDRDPAVNPSENPNTPQSENPQTIHDPYSSEQNSELDPTGKSTSSSDEGTNGSGNDNEGSTADSDQTNYENEGDILSPDHGSSSGHDTGSTTTDVIHPEDEKEQEEEEQDDNSRQVTVTFDTNSYYKATIMGSVLPYIVHIKAGTKISSTGFSYDDLYYEGYSFEGWYTEPGCSAATKWNFDNVVNEDLYLYANWIPADYVVTFHVANGPVEKGTPGTANFTLDFVKGSKINKNNLDDPVIPGFVFEGWYKDSECTDGNEWNFDVDEVNGNIDLWAKWIKGIIITFKPVDKRFFEEFQVTIYPGELIPKPEDPKGVYINEVPYKFSDWYTSQLCTTKWDFEIDKANSDMVLYGKFLSAFQVTFVNSKGTAPDKQLKFAGDKLDKVLDPITDPGWKFKGWIISPDGHTIPFPYSYWDFDNMVMPGNNLFLVADTDYIECTVNYHLNLKEDQVFDGIAPEPVIVDYGAYLTEPSNFDDKTVLADGVTAFNGWFTDKTCRYRWDFRNYKVEEETLDLYASWTDLKHTVTFYDYLNEDANHIIYQEVKHGERIKSSDIPKNPSHAGWKFIGWYYSTGDPENPDDAYKDVEWNFEKDVVTDDIYLWANFEKDEENYVTVTYDYQGHGLKGHDNVVQLTVKYGEYAPNPGDPQENGWYFTGWYQNPECSGPIYGFGNKHFYYTGQSKPLTKDLKLYAGWTRGYTVTFDTNSFGKIELVDNVVTYPSGSKISSLSYYVKLDNPDNQIVGWKNGDNYWDFDRDVITDNIVLKLDVKKPYTITVDCKDPSYYGTVSGSGKYAEGTEVTIKATPSYAFRFKGWAVDGVADESIDGSKMERTIKVDGDHTYTASFSHLEKGDIIKLSDEKKYLVLDLPEHNLNSSIVKVACLEQTETTFHGHYTSDIWFVSGSYKYRRGLMYNFSEIDCYYNKYDKDSTNFIDETEIDPSNKFLVSLPKDMLNGINVAYTELKTANCIDDLQVLFKFNGFDSNSDRNDLVKDAGNNFYGYIYDYSNSTKAGYVLTKVYNSKFRPDEDKNWWQRTFTKKIDKWDGDAVYDFSDEFKSYFTRILSLEDLYSYYGGDAISMDTFKSTFNLTKDIWLMNTGYTENGKSWSFCVDADDASIYLNDSYQSKKSVIPVFNIYLDEKSGAKYELVEE